MLGRFAITTLAFAMAGCDASSSSTRDLRTPEDRAREIEPRCKGVDESDAASLLFSPRTVDLVRPAYADVEPGVDDESRLRGSRIALRPRPGMSTVTLTRLLDCHQVRAILGQVVVSADDPYVLPGRWIDIDVDSGRDGFVVLVRADTFPEARSILERGRRFAATVRQGPSGPPVR